MATLNTLAKDAPAIVKGESIWQTIARLRQHDISLLAPRFRASLQEALRECMAFGVDVVVFETLRSNALAEIYYKQGTSKAPNALRTWHYYGLAVDVISQSRQWDVYPHKMSDGKWDAGDRHWMKVVVDTFKKYGLKWGGDWKMFKDYPHWQWGMCKPSPSDEAIETVKEGGLIAVWKKVKAA